MISSLAHLAVK